MSKKITIKVFTGKIFSNGQSKDINSLLVNYDFINLNIEENSTYDDVLQQCSVYCNISPVYHTLFALWNPARKSWAKLGSTIETSDILISERHECLEFRIRFVIRSEMQIAGEKKLAKRYSLPGERAKPFLNDNVISYLFRQQREDFLQDKFKLETGGEKDNNTGLIEAVLGMSVLDMLYMATEANTDIDKVSHQVKFKYLLPKSIREKLSRPNMNFCNRYRMKKKFSRYLKYFSSTPEKCQPSAKSSSYYQRRYLLNLELLSVSYGVEQYSLTKEGFVTVSADNGIVLHSNEVSDYSEKWCDFSELTDMSLQFRHNNATNLCMVILSKLNCSIKKFALGSLSSAEDFASCIDGYYRLLVDSHHYLCREVCSGNLVRSLQLGCHGPVSCAYAEASLIERESKNIVKVGDCIIRQSQQVFNEYFVNTVIGVNPLHIKNFKLYCDANGKLGLYGYENSHMFDNLEQLLEACKGGKYNGDQVPFKRDQIAFPKIKMKTNMIVRLCSGQSDDVNNNPLNVSQATILKPIDYAHIQNLGHGCFTSVILHKRKDTGQFVIMKSVFDIQEKHELAQKHHIDESFQESMTMLSCLNHEHIIKQIGIMTHHYTVALEYVPKQSITRYLQGNHSDPNATHPTDWGMWFLQVLWQMTHACNYLEDLGFSHGNLCGKNILLWEAFPNPYIKLADPGVKTRCVPRNQTCIIQPLLTAPWLAREFCFITCDPVYPKYPTIEGDKWSFATTVCEILNWGKIEIEPMNAYNLTGNMKQCYENGKVRTIPELIQANKELSLLILQCWNKQFDKRPSFQKILRELSSTLSSDYILPVITPRLSQGTQRESSIEICDSIQHGVPMFEDKNLTYNSCLGEGHFGSVDRFLYDKHQNGRSEYVAVKSLKRSANKYIIDFINEIEIMRNLNHKYVVRLLGITTPTGRIVMEYLEHGSLADHLRKLRPCDRELHEYLLQFSSQIAQGMLALQRKRLIHRDLALRNILLAQDKPNSPLYIKISDFGLSRILDEETDFYFGLLDEFPVHSYAPECLCKDRKRAFLFESDIWSYGVTIWEMFSYGEKPMYSYLPAQSESPFLVRLLDHLQQGNRLKRTADCPIQVYELMLQCWDIEPGNRITFDELRDQFDSLEINMDQLEF